MAGLRQRRSISAACRRSVLQHINSIGKGRCAHIDHVESYVAIFIWNLYLARLSLVSNLYAKVLISADGPRSRALCRWETPTAQDKMNRMKPSKPATGWAC